MTFPLALRLEGKRVVLVGAGPVGLDKSRGLIEAGAHLVVIAPDVHPSMEAAEIHRREFVPSDLDGAWLVFAAATSAVNRAVHAAAEARQIFIVAVDDVQSCSAFGLARIHRGDVTITIGTEGRAPALSALLRRALDRLIPADVAAWAELAARARKKEGTQEERRQALRELLLEEIR